MHTPEKTKEQSPPAKKEKPVVEKKETPPVEEEEEPKLSVDELDKMFAKIKDEGNTEYKAKSFVMAASKFTEGINSYLKYESICKTNKDIMTKVTQLYTNRCLSWHQIGNQADTFNDSNYVLENIDSRNPKALFRRAHCYKDKQQLSLAIKDLELLREVDPKNPVAKKELIELKTL
jgi:tetratricopeptide (TPR) repeat protein